MSTHPPRPVLARASWLPLFLIAPLAAGQDRVDFEGIPTGTILDQVHSVVSGGPILVNAHNPRLSAPNAAVVFDSAAPTGDDWDLGTPNQDFGGPGVGAGGAQGSPYKNDVARGKVLIVGEDLVTGPNGLVIDPDDEAVGGSTMTFDFTSFGAVKMVSICFLDVEVNRMTSVDLFDASEAHLGHFAVPALGNNGAHELGLGDTPHVTKMVVSFGGSGAICGFDFDPDCSGSIGDRVWNDLDRDGVQEDGEPGIAGVRVLLEDGAGLPLGETLTGGEGEYHFGGLCAGDYRVRVDESTLPAGMVVSPCTVGDPALDSDCSPATANLDTDGQQRADVDFGYHTLPFVYCESTPNSTGEAGGVSGSGNPSIAANDFTLEFTNLPVGQPGYIFLGTSQAQVPFGNGIRCIGNPVVRYRKTAISAQGHVEQPLDFTLPPLDQIEPAIPYYFQLWYRDPAGGPPGFNTSDALCVTFAP